MSFCRLRGRRRLGGIRESEPRRPRTGPSSQPISKSTSARTHGRKTQRPPELRGSQPPFTGERVHGEGRLTERKVEPTGPLDSHAIATALRRTLRKINGLKEHKKVPPDFKYKLRPFGAHDLRRTLRTGLSRLGFASDLAERVIGHTVGSMILKTYDLYDRMPERRKALADWDREVRRILANKSNVAKLKTA